MKVTDNFYGSNPTFNNRKLFAQLLNPYDIYSEFADGYKDGVREIEESNKTVEELDEYIEQYSKENEPLSDYVRAYISAYKDYIKQERMVTNEWYRGYRVYKKILHL